MPRYIRKSDPTLADYTAMGALDIREVQPSWLVRLQNGGQFMTTHDRELADKWAERLNAEVEWYTPVQSQTWNHEGSNYDH